MSQLTSRGLDNTSSAFVSDLGPCQGPDPLFVTPIQKKCRKIAYFSQKPQILENLARPYI